MTVKEREFMYQIIDVLETGITADSPCRLAASTLLATSGLFLMLGHRSKAKKCAAQGQEIAENCRCGAPENEDPDAVFDPAKCVN